jgi:spore germination cell wall hydrolase CwlJ-like protein
MSTRRTAAAAMLGLPLAANAVKIEVEPYSEEAARIISYTLYAEARGEPLKGKQAVAAVIQTRARLHGQSLTEVCLKDQQFSCWNELDAVPEYYKTGKGLTPIDLKARSDCFSFAWVLLSSTKKWAHLTHFYNPDLASPSWADALQGKRRIGNHIFGYID